MGESQEHGDLVRNLKGWIAATYGINAWGLCLLCDLPETVEKPPLVGGYRPDIWAVDIPHTLTAIGEAKITVDIENLHTERQLRAYLDYLAVQPRAALVFAVPWSSRASAVMMLENLVRRTTAQHVQRVYLAAGYALRLPR